MTGIFSSKARENMKKQQIKRRKKDTGRKSIIENYREGRLGCENLASHIAKFYNTLCKGILLKTTMGSNIYFACASKFLMKKIVVRQDFTKIG